MEPIKRIFMSCCAALWLLVLLACLSVGRRVTAVGCSHDIEAIVGECRDSVAFPVIGHPFGEQCWGVLLQHLQTHRTGHCLAFLYVLE